MTAIWMRIKSSSYIVWRTLSRYKLTVVGVVLACFGAATALGDPHVAISVAAATAGATVSALEVRANRRRSRKIRLQRRKTDDYRDMLTDYDAAGSVIRTPHDVGVLVEAGTALLRGAPIPVAVDDAPFEIHPDMERYALKFLRRRVRRTGMFNGPVLGLASDLPPTDGDAVEVRSLRFFDFVQTNLVAPYDVYEVGRQQPVLRGRDLIFNSHGRLRSFRYSRLANVIGISTLAFTTDGKLLLICQTVDNAGSPGLIAPSGSGALEPCDLPDSPSLPLQDVLLAGMHRELRQECNLDEDDLTEMAAVTGHARWVSRGAMPEFCAVTLLARSADKLKKGVRRGEKVYVGDVMAVRLPAVPDWSAVSPLDLLPEDLRRAASWPLAFALTCLAESMRDPAWELRDQLQERLDRGAGITAIP